MKQASLYLPNFFSSIPSLAFWERLKLRTIISHCKLKLVNSLLQQNSQNQRQELEDGRGSYLGREEVWSTWRLVVSNYTSFVLPEIFCFFLGVSLRSSPSPCSDFLFPSNRTSPADEQEQKCFSLVIQSGYQLSVCCCLSLSLYSILKKVVAVRQLDTSDLDMAFDSVTFRSSRACYPLTQEIWRRQCHSTVGENHTPQEELGCVRENSSTHTQKEA